MDPYARADFFLTLGPDGGIDVEEGYLTLTSLPWSLLVKVGKLHAAYGKVNQMHTHILPWTDRPLMNVNLAGGEDGNRREGGEKHDEQQGSRPPWDEQPSHKELPRK